MSKLLNLFQEQSDKTNFPMDEQQFQMKLLEMKIQRVAIVTIISSLTVLACTGMILRAIYG